MTNRQNRIARYHLPGLFQFYTFYQKFLPLFYEHREYFYDWCEIGSIYGAPEGCIWGGGRVGEGDPDPEAVLKLLKEYHISGRITFSNALLRETDLSDPKCNALCALFEDKECLEDKDRQQNGIIIHSDLLLHYLRTRYPGFYFVSSTTKVLTEFKQLLAELHRSEFCMVVPDFRLNKSFDQFKSMTPAERTKVEFLVNECCWFGCPDRKRCYEDVSRKNLGLPGPEHVCHAPDAAGGYRFSKAMTNPGFIGVEDVSKVYLPMGFTNFKIEGRGLGSALLLEFLLYYLTKPECQLKVREEIYLDNTLDLF